MVPADSHGISRVPRYSGTCPESRLVFVYRTVTCCGPTFQRGSTNDPICNSPALRPDRPYNPREQAPWFGLFRVRSPLLAESLLFSLPSGTEMVHFPELPSSTYVFSAGCYGINRSGFPHSEIPGSKLVCSSPTLIAAYRVLHRLLAPRHSPYALSSLTIRTQYRAASSWLLAVGSTLFRARCRLPATRCRPHISESTACALVRNYRLQDIQLSKIRRRPLGLRRDNPKWRIPGSNR